MTPRWALRRGLERGDWAAVGIASERRMDAPQAPRAWRDHAAIDALLAGARDAGATAGKVCGAGGGGCIVCLTPAGASRRRRRRDDGRRGHGAALLSRGARTEARHGIEREPDRGCAQRNQEALLQRHPRHDRPRSRHARWSSSRPCPTKTRGSRWPSTWTACRRCGASGRDSRHRAKANGRRQKARTSRHNTETRRG